jgi:putative ABC transport system permease protein
MGFLGFLREVGRMALVDLALRPLRSVLSVTSFTIGISIAVVLVAAGGGLRETVGDMLRNMGEGQIVVKPGRTTGIGGQRRSGRQVRIRYEDVERVRDDLPSFVGTAPFFDLRGHGASSWRYSIPYSYARAVGREYREIRQMPLSEGRWFTAEEEEQAQWVAVLNEGLRRVIYPGMAAVGQWIEWRHRRMKVIGVVRDEALFPYILFMPYTTAAQMTDTRHISGVIARPLAGASWSGAVAELRRVLAGVGDFEPSDPTALEIEDNRDFTGRVKTLTTALHALVITIAAVSLLLGGLGVANMMVIAVTERTREIGLRMAVGAKPIHILAQFLVEALTLSIAGGVIGVLLALGTARHLAARFGWPVVFRPDIIVLAVGFSGLVGIVFGLYPARKASRLDPIEALRYE